jgi:plasmid stability protein
LADLHVRNVPDHVLERLRSQAALEGMSVSEWVRAALADRAELLTPTELAATRSQLAAHALPREEFDRYYAARRRRNPG